MNFINNQLSLRDNFGIEIMELFRVSISSIRNDCILKFQKFSTDFFLGSQKGQNLWNKFIKRFSGKTPSSNSFLFRIFRLMKINIASESFQKPRKNWKFSITNFKMNCINMIRFVSRLPFFDSETSFSINKSSHVSQIFFTWNNKIRNLLKRFDIFFSDEIIHVSYLPNFFDKFFSFFYKNFSRILIVGFGNRITKLNEVITKFFFLDKKSLNFISNFFTMFVFYRPNIRNLLFWSLLFSSICTSKCICEIRDNILINTKNLDAIFINNIILFLKEFSCIETSVSIKISSQIRESRFIFHDKYINDKLNNNQDPQRLSGEKTVEYSLCDSPNHFENRGGRNNKTSRLRNQVKKVTECRQTEDQLMRDMLASTASFINCTNGVNGKKRVIAVVKSSLIDLELLAA